MFSSKLTRLFQNLLYQHFVQCDTNTKKNKKNECYVTHILGESLDRIITRHQHSGAETHPSVSHGYDIETNAKSRWIISTAAVLPGGREVVRYTAQSVHHAPRDSGSAAIIKWETENEEGNNSVCVCVTILWYI